MSEEGERLEAAGLSETALGPAEGMDRYIGSLSVGEQESDHQYCGWPGRVASQRGQRQQEQG